MTPRPVEAAVVVVGTEILEDGRLDTNGPFIEASLAGAGFRTVLRIVVGDDAEAIAAAIRTAAWRAGVVIVSGGLGPTFDDLTREGAAAALGLALERRPDVESALRERFRRRGLTPPESVFRMADALVGADILRNAVGSAPGIFLAGPPSVALVPGVPVEMEAMVAGELLPRLTALHHPAPAERRIFRIAGLYESEVEARLEPRMSEWKEVDRTILASAGDVTLILRASPASRHHLERASADVRTLLGDAVYAEANEGIPAAIAKLLGGTSLKLATAESCTGGMLGSMITGVPGSSAFYVGGVVVYSDRMKREWLDVPGETLERHGAVSAETALAMARGVCSRSGADLGIAITGIAGPGGGTPDKPVGLVHIALAGRLGESGSVLGLPGDRETIRVRACRVALDLLRLALLRGGAERTP